MMDHQQFATASTVGVPEAMARYPALSAEQAALCGLPLTEAARMAASGDVSAVALTLASLKASEVFEPQLNAFITVCAEQALRDAEALDAARKSGKPCGPLHGVTICLKDNIDTAGVRTTAGSPVLQDRVPAEDATIVARLRAAGAVILGKNNLNEFCMDDGQTSFYGRVRNPWALDRETGGSSSGTCAAVSADMTHGGIGNDTGGSVRNPAAMCGVVGLKPTNGLVPNRGGVALSPSLDVNGPITRTVADAALLLNVIAGYDALDITCDESPSQDYLAQMAQPVAGLRVGLPVGRFDQLTPEVHAAIREALAVIRSLVAEVKDVALPTPRRAMALMPFAETYLVHRDLLKGARFLYSQKHRDLLDGLAEGRAVDYIEARHEMMLARRTINGAFGDFDLIVQPSLHIVANRLEIDRIPDPEKARGPGALYDAGLFNVLGLPAISVPCGFSPEGLPIGLCIAGPRHADGRVLALAHAYEQATSWRKRRPPLVVGAAVPPIPRRQP